MQINKLRRHTDRLSPRTGAIKPNAVNLHKFKIAQRIKSGDRIRIQALDHVGFYYNLVGVTGTATNVEYEYEYVFLELDRPVKRNKNSRYLWSRISVSTKDVERI